MTKDNNDYLLQQAGFELVGPDTWGKVVGEATAFLVVYQNYVSAWAWLPDAEKYLGPKLHIDGTPEAAVPEALFQLQGLLGEESATGALPRDFDSVSTERIQVCAP